MVYGSSLASYRSVTGVEERRARAIFAATLLPGSGLLKKPKRFDSPAFAKQEGLLATVDNFPEAAQGGAGILQGKTH